MVEVTAKKVILRDVNTGGFLLPMADTSTVEKEIDEVESRVNELENKIAQLKGITYEEY